MHITVIMRSVFIKNHPKHYEKDYAKDPLLLVIKPEAKLHPLPHPKMHPHYPILKVPPLIGLFP